MSSSLIQPVYNDCLAICTKHIRQSHTHIHIHGLDAHFTRRKIKYIIHSRSFVWVCVCLCEYTLHTYETWNFRIDLWRRRMIYAHVTQILKWCDCCCSTNTHIHKCSLFVVLSTLQFLLVWHAFNMTLFCLKIVYYNALNSMPFYYIGQICSSTHSVNTIKHIDGNLHHALQFGYANAR